MNALLVHHPLLFCDLCSTSLFSPLAPPASAFPFSPAFFPPPHPYSFFFFSGTNSRNKVGETPLDCATKHSLMVHSPSKQLQRIMHCLEDATEDFDQTATDTCDTDIGETKPFYKFW